MLSSLSMTSTGPFTGRPARPAAGEAGPAPSPPRRLAPEVDAAQAVEIGLEAIDLGLARVEVAPQARHLGGAPGRLAELRAPALLSEARDPASRAASSAQAVPLGLGREQRRGARPAPPAPARPPGARDAHAGNLVERHRVAVVRGRHLPVRALQRVGRKRRRHRRAARAEGGQRAEPRDPGGADHGAAATRGARGRTTVNRLPAPSSRRGDARPPCASTDRAR